MKRLNLKLTVTGFGKILYWCNKRCWSISFFIRTAVCFIIDVIAALENGDKVAILNKQGEVDREIHIPF